MEVDFNNLRKQAAYSLDRVIKTLNSGILPETEHILIDEGENKKWVSGDVLVSKEDLQDDIDALRQHVWILLCCFEKDNPNYACVYEDVEKSGGLARFNDEAEQ